MRVLHVVTRFASGGSERDILRQVCWEQAQGFEVEVAIGGAGAVASPAEGVVARPVPSLIPALRPTADARAFRELRSLMRDQRYDIVHTHQSKAGVLGRIAARGTATAIAHTVHMASFGPGYSGPTSRLQAAAERYCGRFTDVIVCVGEELRERYLGERIADPERYALMRTPVDIDAFAAARTVDAETRVALRSSFGLPPETPVVLAIGALEPRKRHALLIDRLAALLGSGNVVLALAGEGPERLALERQVAELRIEGAVHFLGQTPRVHDLLACSDVLALTSRVEGVPRVLIEALAAGVPVVATDVEGLREVPGAPVSIVSRDGEGLSEAVRQLVSGPRPDPVPLEALGTWRPSAVDDQIASIHERLARCTRPRRQRV